jgi:hypothetical protein
MLIVGVVKSGKLGHGLLKVSRSYMQYNASLFITHIITFTSTPLSSAIMHYRWIQLSHPLTSYFLLHNNMLNLRFSQRWIWIVPSSGIKRHVVWWKSIDLLPGSWLYFFLAYSRHWIWRRYVPPKRRSTFTELNGVICHIGNNIFLAVQSLLCIAVLLIFSFSHGSQFLWLNCRHDLMQL